MNHPFLKVTFLCALLAITSGTLKSQTQSTDTLTVSLKQCIDIALTDNPTVRVADMEVKRAHYSKREIEGQLLPSIDFAGQYSRTLAKQTMYMNMKGFGSMGSMPGDDASEEAMPKSSGDGGIKVGLDNSYQLGFSASMPLIAPQLWKSIKLSDTQILQNIESARASRLSLVKQVKSAYYTLMLTLDSYRVITENYEMARFTADLYQKKFELGAATRYDVLRTQVAVKNLEPELSQAEVSIKQASLQLLVLMGVDVFYAVRPEEDLASYEGTMYERSLSQSRNIDDNTDLRSLNLQTRQLSDALAIQKMSWYPTLSLTASYNWTSMNDGTPFKSLRWNPYSLVGVNLSFPIFQGGQRYNRIRQAKVQLAEMTFQKQNLERSLRMQVDVSIDNINTNIRQITSCSESMRQAEMAHDIVKQSFEIGAASYLDLRDGELALTQSRLAYLQSIYNYLVADNDLEYLLGNYQLEK